MSSSIERLRGVLVAGAGPVGAITALRLAKAGIPVTLLEAEPSIANSPRAIVYHPPTVAVLDRLGLLERASAMGVTKQDYQFRTPDGRIIARMDMTCTEGDTPYPFNLHLGQHRLAQLATDDLLALPDTEVHWSHRVVAVEQDASGVTVTAETPNGARHFRADWLVGADGGRSGVRTALGLAFDGFTWPERFMAVNIRYDFTACGFALANFLVDPIDWAIIPVISPDGLWRIAYGEDPDISEREALARLPAKLARILPDPGRPYEVELAAPYRVHERVAERFRVGRVLLAGDAAHLNNPVGGLGLTGGILDADALGDALGGVITGRYPDAALDHYARERRRVFTEFTSPTASENKRRLAEADPARRAEDRARLARIDTDPAFQRDVLLATQKLVAPMYSELAAA